MKIKKLSFKNYKAFPGIQTIELKPITVLIGKNSSGKSSIAKLFTMLENSLSGEIDVPMLLNNNEVCLGGEFRDLVYNQDPSTPIEFNIVFEDDSKMFVSIIQPISSPSPIILKWCHKNKSLDDFCFTYDEKNGKYERQGLTYDINFKGFIPNFIHSGDDIEDLSTLDNLTKNIKVDYIGPFRLVPPRGFLLSGKQEYYKMGIFGENAYNILGNNMLRDKLLVKQVGDWYEKNFDGWNLEVSNALSPFNQILLHKSENPDVKINIIDVGQGMSQALPLVVRAFMEDDNSLVVLEQPELHLHPAAHGDMAELFANSTLTKNHNYIIETHSENFILRLRKLIADDSSKLQPEDVIIYSIEHDESNEPYLLEITINNKGELSDWPDGVFTENLDEIQAINRVLKVDKKKA
ncbi:MAG TPA: DUF3696 domain-containing protein [Prolixibacteraceae bacterium]|nr:DUF3696 domain-containing protein [Prolixibacteraceae bacterium]